MTDPTDPGSPVDIDFETVFRAAPGGSVITDAEYTILDVNDGFVAWTGLDRERVMGTSFLRLLPVGDRILFSTRSQPLLDLTGRLPGTAITVLGRDRIALPAVLGGSCLETDPAVTVFVMAPKRERSAEESLLLSAVHRAEHSDARREEAERDLEHQARHDQLTGLPNRAGLLAALPDVLPGLELTAFWIGLDHFRVINESLGRTAGDDILTIIAGRLRQHSGGEGVLARVGGDEFVVVSGGPGRAQVLLDLIEQPIQVEELEIVVTASIGTATRAAAAPDDTRTDPSLATEAVLRNAGTGMHKAKAAGRNRWKHVTAGSDDSAINEIRLLGEIRAAIAGDQLRLEYQPQLDLRTGRLHGFEALIRWEHPVRGLIGPSGFIDVAEKTGLISQLGTWACHTAIVHAGELDELCELGGGAGPGDGGDAPIRMSVNISARQLSDAHFADTIEALLRRTRLEPTRLTLEITETGLITDATEAMQNLRRLDRLGVQLSIDDFGTGHAGFSYLNDLPIHEIKIDRSYIDKLDTSPEATAIVVSCIELAHALDVTVVAEGVETAAQLARLTELGCDIAQGFHYSRPLTADAVPHWVREEAACHR